MDERRDLVDREELRRLFERNTGAGYSYSWSAANRKNLAFLDAMPAVECPRGWTRDEVLKELDADPDAVCDDDLLYMAWGLIANATGGDWNEADRLSPGWKAAAERWRDAWHRTLPGRVAPEPEWVPLTQLVGRTIDGCSGVVDRDPSALSGEGWRWYDGREWHPFPEGTLNLETGQVAVRPKAAT